MTRFIPLLFVLLWSTGFIGAKYALPYIEPFKLLFIRMAITLVILLLLIRWRGSLVGMAVVVLGVYLALQTRKQHQQA